jgi:hypothetical protein
MSSRIELAAQELVDRHGEGVLEVAKERVELLKRSGKQPDLDLAMLLLTELRDWLNPFDFPVPSHALW